MNVAINDLRRATTLGPNASRAISFLTKPPTNMAAESAMTALDLSTGLRGTPFQHIPHDILFMGKTALPSLAAYFKSTPANLVKTGLVVYKPGSKIIYQFKQQYPQITFSEGDHPVPGIQSENSQSLIQEFVSSRSRPTQVCKSGGTTALANCSDLLPKTRAILLESGKAGIDVLNIISRDLGGCAGGKLLSLIPEHQRNQFDVRVISDVAGDSFYDIGSGPFTPNPTSGQSYGILGELGLLDKLTSEEQDYLKYLETIPTTPTSTEIPHTLIASLEIAAQGALTYLKQNNYKSLYIPEYLTDKEARLIGAEAMHLLLEQKRSAPNSKVAVVLTGEPLVTITNPNGSGGRAREAALGAIIKSSKPCYENFRFSGISFATDGDDGPNALGVAGATFDNTTHLVASERQLNPQESLDNNDSGTFFKEMNLSYRFPESISAVNVRDLLILCA